MELIEGSMNLVEWARDNPGQAIGSLVAAVSLGFNVIQWLFRRKEKALLRAHFQAAFNDHHRIAECMSRAVEWLRRTDMNRAVRDVLVMLGQVNGVVDSARVHIAATAREMLKQTVFREHPAHPGEHRTGQPGWPPLEWSDAALNAGTHPRDGEV